MTRYQRRGTRRQDNLKAERTPLRVMLARGDRTKNVSGAIATLTERKRT